MSTHQIQACFYPGPSGSRCRERLKFLFDEGYIGRMEQPSILSEGRRPFIWYPKRKAAELGATIDGISVDDIAYDKTPLPVDSDLHNHILAVADVNIAFTKATQKYGFPMRWLNELMLRQKGMIDQFEIRDPNSVKRKASVIPDAHMCITTPNRPYLFQIEVDNGTESLQTIAMKTIKYLYYFSQPTPTTPSLYAQRYGTETGRVLFVLPGQQRAAHIQQVIQDNGGASRFWIVTRPELLTHDPLYEHIWIIVGREKKSPLLK